MAWRLDDNGDIVIDGWEKGIGADPYTGLADLRGVNIYTIPGEVSYGFPLTGSTTSGGTLGKPIHDATQFSAGSATAYYILDATSQVWKSTTLTGTWTFLGTGNVTTSADATNQGLAYWKGYLFKFRADKIDYLVGGTLGTWATGAAWQSITNANHYALVGQDDVLYFCNGQYIGSIMEKAGQTFDPGNTATYTFNAQALALPSNDYAQSMAEQGTNLLVGGSQNAIYPWDRISPSFKYPIFLADYFIKKMVTANSNVFVFPGNVAGRGRIYVTNGSQIDLYYKIPDHLFGVLEPYYRWGGARYYRDKLVFSFEVDNNSSTQLTPNSCGVYALDIEDKSFSLLSGGSNGLVTSVLIPDQSGSAAAGMAYIAGTYDASAAFTISRSSTAAGTNGSGATDGIYIVVSDAIPVGTFLKKKTFTQVEFKLSAALASGESLQLSSIADLAGSATSIGTFNTVGAFSGTLPVNFQTNQWLNIQAKGIAVTTGVRLKEIRLR